MNSVRVLIVEDDPMVQQINREFVEQLPGFAVVGVVRGGREAVEAVQATTPDLVLLDVYLPEQDGVTALKEIRRAEVATDVILITAATDTETVREALRYGAVDYGLYHQALSPGAFAGRAELLPAAQG